MADYTIVLGNKAYSSWSLRGWLLLRQSGVAFDEIVIPLDRPETKAEIRRHSPARKVPVLRAGTLTVWDTLAIAEFLNERFPDAGLWPADPDARAIARSAAAECMRDSPPCAAACPWICAVTQATMRTGPRART